MNSKAILITGASKRLGLHFAKTSLDMGYAVIIHYHNPLSDIEKKQLFKQQFYNKVFYIQYDLSDQPEKLLDRISDFPVELEGLVNNASVFSKGNLSNISHFESLFKINFAAPMKLSQRFSEIVKNGWIINITDSNNRKFNRNFQNYRLTKLFLEELTRQQASLYAPDIRVNGIAPGAILPSNEHEAKYFLALAEKIPLGRTGDIQSLMDAFRFLVNASFITGEIVKIDGGLNLVS